MKNFIVAMLAWFAVPAMAGKTLAVAPADLDRMQALDEVVVQGDRTLSSARQAIVDAEDRFYARWNALNSERKFDISCYVYAPTGTRFTKRICEPRFASETYQAEAQRMMLVSNGVVMPNFADPERAVLTMQLRKRTLAMLEKDPPLKRALLERARLEQHYETLVKEKFKNRRIVWD